MLNKVQLIGRLGKDPEVRRLNSGSPVVNFSLATTETWRDKNSGERKEKTEWHNIVIFNENIAKVAEQYLRKGALIFIEGAMQTRKWQDSDGNDRYSTEVVLQNFKGELKMLGGNGDGDQDRGSSRGRSRDRDDDRESSRSNSGGGTSSGRNFSRDLDDEIPFAPEWR